MNSERLQTFDPKQPYNVVWRHLPHWAQAGTVCFITWRTADSMPREVVARWIAERDELLHKAGIARSRVSPKPGTGFGETGLQPLLRRLPPAEQARLQLDLMKCFDAHLDACRGACILKDRALATIVADSLLKFDGQRYELTDFVVMPNHVHLLAAFQDEDTLLAQCAGWKRYTARQINDVSGRRGELWQEDAFDHLVRDAEQFEHYRCYIADNGARARLPPDLHARNLASGRGHYQQVFRR
jgi:putative transposase